MMLLFGQGQGDNGLTHTNQLTSEGNGEAATILKELDERLTEEQKRKKQVTYSNAMYVFHDLNYIGRSRLFIGSAIVFRIFRKQP